MYCAKSKVLSFFLGLLVSLSLSLPAMAKDNEELARQLQQIFKEHPELIMDVLRNNSEAILDIAQQGANLRRKATLEKQWRADAKEEKHVKLEDRPVLGNKNAKVRIVAFSDFTCNFCQQASVTIDTLMKEYGKNICFVFKNLPLEGEGPGVLASQYFVAISLQSEKEAWDFYATVFQNRDKLITKGESFLQDTVKNLKIDKKRLEKDRQSKKVLDLLREDMEDAKKLGIDGTPCFLVNNLVVRGALPLELFKTAVDIALEESSKK